MNKIKFAFAALFTAGLTSMASAQSEPAGQPATAPAPKTATEVEHVKTTQPADASHAVQEKAAAEVREEAPVQPKLSPAERKETLSEMAAEEEAK